MSFKKIIFLFLNLLILLNISYSLEYIESFENFDLTDNLNQNFQGILPSNDFISPFSLNLNPLIFYSFEGNLVDQVNLDQGLCSNCPEIVDYAYFGGGLKFKQGESLQLSKNTLKSNFANDFTIAFTFLATLLLKPPHNPRFELIPTTRTFFNSLSCA